MKVGTRISLADGTVVQVVDRWQKAQTVGWWVDKDGNDPDLPDRLEGMWERYGECEWIHAYYCLCPVNELDEQTASTALPVDSQARKDTPMVRGLLDYFPAALAEVARLSMEGNRKHNPGAELHWSRDKSTDHADCIMRH